MKCDTPGCEEEVVVQYDGKVGHSVTACEKHRDV